MEIQLGFQDYAPFRHHLNITIVADRMELKSNMGALFRLSDALGIRKLIFYNTSEEMDKKLTRIARSSDQHVEFMFCNSKAELSQEIPKGAKIIALEWTSRSENILEYRMRCKDDPLFIIIGSERTGVSDELLPLAEQAVHIPMFGKNSSMNVVTATAILSYEIIRQNWGQTEMGNSSTQ